MADETVAREVTQAKLDQLAALMLRRADPAEVAARRTAAS